jgi:acyl-CoA dehydrogenase
MDQSFLDQIEKFCESQLLPQVQVDESKGNFNAEIYQKFSELGICGITTEEKFEGLGLGITDLCEVLKVVAGYSVSYAVTISVSSMVQSILSQFGTDEQKAKYLPKLACGNSIGAFSLSESNSGSDAGGLKLSAKKTQGGYLLNGNKMWVTSGGVAETYIVMARTGEAGTKGISAFILSKGMEGFSFGKKEDKMGWKSSPTAELVFENCFVEESRLLNNENTGFKIAMEALNKGRITIGAIAVGLADKALKYAVKYALQRTQFDKPIYAFQGLQFLIAENATEIVASNALVNLAAKNYDEKNEDIKVAAMAKLKATDTAMKVTTDAVQILGGAGYTTEYPVERFMRDAKVLQIVEGTNQIQKIIIAKKIKEELI